MSASRFDWVPLVTNTAVARDERVPSNIPSVQRSFCDLEAVGYRLVEDWTSPIASRHLELVYKIYHPITDWIFCQPLALIDIDDDERADYELIGEDVESHEWTVGTGSQGRSILVDARQKQDLTRRFELSYIPGKSLDYDPAVIGLESYQTYNFATVAVLRLGLDAFHDSVQKLSILPAMQSLWQDQVADDYTSQWLPIYLDPFESGFLDFGPGLTVRAGDYEDLQLTKGLGKGPLMLVYPQNPTTFSRQGRDQQSQTMEPSYLF